MSETQSIHGHTIIEMVTRSPSPFTRQSLIDAVHAQFGEDARFHNCSSGGMTCAGLLDFFSAKGKLVEDEHGLRFVRGGAGCDH